MKKIFWVIPAAMFLVSLAAVVILNARDIKPEDMVFDTSAAELVGISQAQAVTMLENNLDAFSARAIDDAAAVPEVVKSVVREGGTVKFILGERFGSYTQYIAYGDAGAAYNGEEEGYNLAAYRRELFGGWTYCVDYIKELTFAKRYTAALSPRLEEKGYAADDCQIELVLMLKELCASPAEKSKSAYVVRARILLPDGALLTGFFDPKTKAMIGFAQ